MILHGGGVVVVIFVVDVVVVDVVEPYQFFNWILCSPFDVH